MLKMNKTMRGTAVAVVWRGAIGLRCGDGGHGIGAGNGFEPAVSPV